MKHFTLTALLLVCACASSSQTYTQDGSIGHTINCSGTARNWGMCYTKAGEICGSNGYDIVEKTSEQGYGGTGSASSDASISGNAGSASAWALLSESSLHFRTMVIKCK